MRLLRRVDGLLRWLSTGVVTQLEAELVLLDSTRVRDWQLFSISLWVDEIGREVERHVLPEDFQVGGLHPGHVGHLPAQEVDVVAVEVERVRVRRVEGVRGATCT